MSRMLIAAAGWLAATLVAAPGSAQRVDPTRIIDLHVNAEADNRSFDATVVEGKRFRLSFDGVGTFEIMPLVLNQARGTFRVTVYRGPEGAESADLRLVETVDAQVGVPVALRSMPSVGLVIDGVRSAEAVAAMTSNQAVRSAWRGFAMQDDCCVTCGNVTACGCRVVADCDFCCVAPCCKMEDPASFDRIVPATDRSFARMAGQCGNPIKDEERIHTTAAGAARIASAR